MADSGFDPDKPQNPFQLSSICSHTLVQRNRGFRRCNKPGVHTTSTDLVHAYREVALRARGMGNVLILEDDAQVLTAATRHDFAQVDAFVANHAFDIYTLGSTGSQRQSPHPGHPRVAYTGASHAIIWSEASRASLLQIPAAAAGIELDIGLKHIDGCFLAKLPLVYTFRDPLVGQIYTRTENSFTWSHLGLSEATQTRGGPLVWLDQRIVGIHLWWLGVRYGLDRDTSGWATLYRNERQNAALVDHGASTAWCLALVGVALALLTRKPLCRLGTHPHIGSRQFTSLPGCQCYQRAASSNLALALGEPMIRTFKTRKQNIQS
jgi:hypothetical protein